MAKRRLHLTFPKPLVDQPIIGRMTKQFDVLPNIRRANVDQESGWIDLELGGDEEELERAIAFLKEQGVDVSPIERDVLEH